MVSESVQTAIVLGGVAALLLLSVVTFYPEDFTPVQTQDGIKKFNSYDEIKTFLKENTQTNYWRGDIMMETTTDMTVSKSMSDTAGSAPEASQSAGDFSTTNIQVEGVDEADIVKNDGKYIYTLSGNTLSIVDAYPADNAKLISNITIDGNPQELYINDNTLVVLGNKYTHHIVPVSPENDIGIAKEMMPQRRSSTYAFAESYDITDKKNPKNIKTVSVDGNYFDSRMIGEEVYIIATQYTSYYDDGIIVPRIMTSAGGATVNKTPEVYYFDMPDTSYSFTSIVSVNTQNEKEDVEGKIYLLGATRNMYVSQDNIYITYQKRIPEIYFYERMVDTVITPLVSATVSREMTQIQESDASSSEKMDAVGGVFVEYIESLTPEQERELEIKAEEKMEELQREIAKESEKTIVHKIAIKDGKINYKATGTVPGHVLNQFSMDEYDNHFRIATTTGRITRMGAQTSANHIYVLDSELKQVGALEDLAPGETIYSARFMGKRAYMVTFVKIDPLFVIDLSNPKNPKVLGKLKIPGYSDYLHPYDENHIIGIGKETEMAETKNFVWQQGVKLALFDVTDVENPKELSTYVIGDRGTDSYALHDHKAFLFSKDRNLLVIPILLAEMDESKYADELPEWAYGEYVWQGAFVFNIDTSNGIELKGKITHANEDDDSLLKSGWYYYGSKYSVKRSLYMDDTLYTVSDGMVKANDLNDLSEIKAIELPVSETYPKYFEY